MSFHRIQYAIGGVSHVGHFMVASMPQHRITKFIRAFRGKAMIREKLRFRTAIGMFSRQLIPHDLVRMYCGLVRVRYTH